MTALADRWVIPGLTFLADWSARWAVVLLLLALWLKLKPPRQAATRHLLCTVMLIAGLLLPLAPRWGFVTRAWPAPRALRVEPSIADPPRELAAREPAPAPGPGFVPRQRQAQHEAVPLNDPPRTHAPAHERRLPPRAALGPWRGSALVIGLFWAGAVIVLLARLAGGQLLVARLKRDAQPVGDRLLGECRRTLGLTRPVTLNLHPAIGSPVVVGGRRALILVPPDWEGWPESQRRACLLHELAHLARYDDMAKPLQELIRVPFFFHPLVRWLLRQLDRERELLCDETVVRHGVEPLAYARLLLDLARRPGRLLPGAVRLRPAWLPFFEPRTVAARIQRLLEDDMRLPRSPLSTFRLCVLGAAACAAALGIGGLRVRAVEPPQKAEDRPAVVTPPPRVPGPQPRTASGVVKDAAGNPLAGVQIVAGVEHPELIETGADGRFQFAVPEGEVLYKLAVYKDGFTVATRDVFVPAGQAAREQEIRLDTPSPFTATLVDKEGQPFAGATVRLMAIAQHRKLRDTPVGGITGATYQTSYTTIPWKLLPGTPLERVFTTTSDDRGHIALSGLPRDCWVRLTAQIPGRGLMLVAHQNPVAGPGSLVEEGYVTSPADAPATLTSIPAARIQGQVMTRLPGVSVVGLGIALQGAREPGSMVTTNNWAESRADAEGRFTIDGLNPGIANVFLRDDKPDGPWTYRAAKDARLVSGETTDVQIELVRGVAVEGRVVAEGTDQPVAALQVGVYGPSRPRSGPAIIAAMTDHTGTYRFRLPPGETYVYVCGWVYGYQTLPDNRSSRTVVIPDDRPTFTVPPIEVQPSVRIRGQVVDRRGLPVMGARIMAVCDAGVCMPVDQPLAVSDALGHFRLADQVGGQFPMNRASRFQVKLRDGREFELPAVPDEVGRVVLTIQALPSIEVRGPATVPPRALAGVVVDVDGKPIEGVEVMAYHWIPNPPTMTTDKDGFFQLNNFSDNDGINLRLRKEGYETQYHDRATGQPGWVAVLGNRTFFEGRVLAPGGAPVAGATIRADSGPKRYRGYMQSETLTETRSGPDGQYRLYVVPAQYDIAVRIPGTGVARLTDRTIGVDQQQPLDIRLEPGATFAAQVIDHETRQPVTGVRLTHWQRPGIEGTSDSDGQITIRDVPPGNYPRFDVKTKGYTRWWSDACLSEWSRYQKTARNGFQRNFDDLDFNIQPGMKPVTIELERGVTIKGRVLDPDEKPVAGATVAPALTGTGNSLTGDTRFSVETKSDGTFTMVLPSSGDRDYNLEAHDGKYGELRTWANGVLPPFRTRPGEELSGVTLHLTRPATVRGRVTDTHGQPVAGREVRASAGDRLENRYYDPSVETGDDGTYELKGIRPGEQFIQVGPLWLDARQAPAGTSQTLTLNAGETREGIDFRVSVSGPR